MTKTGDDAELRIPLDILSDEELQDIRQASIRILAEIGIEVMSGSARETLKRAGAETDAQNGRILISEELLRESIESAPKKIALYGRDKKNACELFDRECPALATDGTGYQIFDYPTKRVRKSTTRDLFRCATIAEALPDVEIFWPMVIAGDVPEAEHTAKELAVSFVATSKHIQHEASDPRCALVQIKMARAVAGGEEELRKRPVFSAVQCPISPLIFEESATESMSDLCTAGIPIVGMSISVAGATTPISIASALAMANAETLASLVISQSMSKGTPYIYSVSSSAIDFQQLTFLSGAPELALISAGAAQLARSYGLPSLIAGLVTDARYPSQQAGFEKMQSGLLAALSGASIIGGIGAIDSDNVTYIEQMIIDADIWGSIRRILKGITPVKGAISLEEIGRIRTEKGFQNDIETAKRYPKEIWQPRLPYRQSYSGWKASGDKTIEELAHEQIRIILSDGGENPLDRDTEKEIMAIFKEYQRELHKSN